MADERYVAVGFLSQAYLDILGSSFTRCFSVQDDETFSDLIARLDTLEPLPAVVRMVPESEHLA